MPKTHCIEVSGDDQDGRATFLVDCLAFLVGMRLATTEAGYLDATPVEPGKLNDIVQGGSALADGLTYADAFWSSLDSTQRVAKAMRAVIRSLMLSQDPNLLDYERFLYLYTAIDACYFIYQARPKALDAGSHGARLSLLCSELGTVKPDWLADVVKARNEAIHRRAVLRRAARFSRFRAGQHSVVVGATSVIGAGLPVRRVPPRHPSTELHRIARKHSESVPVELLIGE